MPANKTIAAEGNFRRQTETEAIADYVRVFENSPDSTQHKLHNFIKYVRRQDVTKWLARYEIFKKVLPVKGSVVECGVYRGAGLMSWALFSDMMEPVNLTRRIYGFDTFEGFPDVSGKDSNSVRNPNVGDLNANVHEELTEIIKAYDKNRFLGHVEKVKLIKGNASQTIPAFIKENRHLMVSLLFLDFDLYEPTKVALEHFVPRMPRGAVIAFDELDNPIWPGETMALLDTVGMNRLKIQRLDFDPYIGFAVLE